jgi:glycosyltransferase involved in cell wall biosynthesis
MAVNPRCSIRAASWGIVGSRCTGGPPHVGSGPGEAELDGVVELRPATYDEMPDLYREADVVVYPTIGAEPYGLVPLEAMSSGRPIVASRSGGMTETIVDGTTGFIVSRGDVTELTERVGQLLRAPARRRRMGQAARRHVVAHFGLSASWTTCCGDIRNREAAVL